MNLLYSPCRSGQGFEYTGLLAFIMYNVRVQCGGVANRIEHKRLTSLKRTPPP